jgi:hypothetical protein
MEPERSLANNRPPEIEKAREGYEKLPAFMMDFGCINRWNMLFKTENSLSRRAVVSQIGRSL